MKTILALSEYIRMGIKKYAGEGWFQFRKTQTRQLIVVTLFSALLSSCASLTISIHKSVVVDYGGAVGLCSVAASYSFAPAALRWTDDSWNGATTWWAI
jgi:hypothetical protein